MSPDKSKPGTGELTLIYMNGSVVPLAGHELVAALRNRYAVLMLMATVVLLSIPSGGGFFGDGSLWERVLVNIAAVCVFIALFPALLIDAQDRARINGRARLHLITVSMPAAILATLSAAAFGIILTDGQTTRWSLLAKLGFGLIFWEAVVFLGVWFYGPVLGRHSQTNLPEHKAELQLSLGTLQINPHKLTRIETDGRHLHLHLDGTVQTISARLKDISPLLEPYGLQVHRCHWVAFDQIRPVVVQGRSYEMTTRQGDVIPVSRDRRDKVRAALAMESRP